MSFLSRLALALLALRLVKGPTAWRAPRARASIPAPADRRLDVAPVFPWAVLAFVCAAAALGMAASMAWRGARAAAQRIEVAKALTRGDPARAPDLVRRYGCGGCHSIPGIAGADGKAAPALSDMRERVYVGGVVRNNGDNLVRWIVNPPLLSPRTAMPVTGITEGEARDVAAYLYAR